MPIDPIAFEVFKSLFVSVAEEMGVTLCRTSFSPNIKERLDYSCAIYDGGGDTIAQGDHIIRHPESKWREPGKRSEILSDFR